MKEKPREEPPDARQAPRCRDFAETAPSSQRSRSDESVKECQREENHCVGQHHHFGSMLRMVNGGPSGQQEI
jgi:hypothetical protein